MVSRAYFARRFLALKLLRGALAVGALYDAVIAAMLVWHPNELSPMLGSRLAEGWPLTPLAALWLALLAALALAAAGDIRRYSAVIAAVLVGRVLTAALLALTTTATATVPWMAVVNGMLALTLAAAWWPIRQ